MIIWIDGPFGAGKTTLAAQLCERLPDILLFDPEEIGHVVKTIVPMPPGGNYQDLPLWRGLTIRAIAEIRAHYLQDILVPMTLLRHRDEILARVRSVDPCLGHFYLDIDTETLRKRIARQVIHPDSVRNARIRNWRLAQIEACRVIRQSLSADTHILDSGVNDPDALAAMVMDEMQRMKVNPSAL